MNILGWNGRALWALLTAAVMVRVMLFSVIVYHPELGDANSYHQCALNLLHHGTYSDSTTAPYVPTVYRAPLYASFVAAVYGLLGTQYWAVQAVQVALSLASVCLLSSAVARVDAATGKAVFPLLLLLPFDALYAGALLSETLTTFLVSLMVYLCATWEDTVKRAACLGIAAALLALCRDIYVPLLAVLPLVYLVGRRSLSKPGLLRAVVYWACLATLVGIWTLRNFHQTGEFVLVSKGRLGFSLWMGTWATNGDFTKSDATGRVYPAEAYRSDMEKLELEAERDPALLDRVYMRYAKEHFRGDPTGVLKRWLVRAPLLWVGTRTDIFEFRPDWFPRGSLQWKALKVGFLAVNSLVLLVGAVGIFLAAKRLHPLLWLAIPLVYTTALFFPLNSFENRYSQPVYGLLAAFAAYGFTRAHARWFSRPA